jgi:uncharacterized membrane protein
MMALAMINLVVAWITMALLPKDSATYIFRSEAEKTFKKFVLTFDWSMIFMIVGMSVLVTVSLWLILSSYGKLPSEDTNRSLDNNDAA